MKCKHNWKEFSIPEELRRECTKCSKIQSYSLITELYSGKSVEFWSEVKD